MSGGAGETCVAVLRPDDDRLEEAVRLLESFGVTPVADPMLEVLPTGAVPRTDADYVILTSKTGVELAAANRWTPGEAIVCAIGDRTARALGTSGMTPDIVPEEFTSSGLVSALEEEVDGARVEVARSDHGSSVLTDGLEAAGAYVHETVLYELVRPAGSGRSTELAASGELDALLFTSALTVEHFLEAADERGLRDEAVGALRDAVVGAIGEPTRETAESFGIDVDVVPASARFDELAREAVERCVPTTRG